MSSRSLIKGNSEHVTQLLAAFEATGVNPRLCDVLLAMIGNV